MNSNGLRNPCGMNNYSGEITKSHPNFLFHLTIDKTIWKVYNSAGRQRTLRPEIPVYHSSSNLSSKKLKKVTQIIFPKFVHFTSRQNAMSVLYYNCSKGNGKVR